MGEGVGVWILYLSNIHTHTVAEHLWSASTSPYENDYCPLDSIEQLSYNFSSFLKTISSMKVSTNHTTSFQRSITFHERIRETFRLNFNGTKRIPFFAAKLIDMMTDLLSTPCLDTTHLIPGFITISELDVITRFEFYSKA